MTLACILVFAADARLRIGTRNYAEHLGGGEFAPKTGDIYFGIDING